MKDVEKLVDSNGVVMQIVDGAARDMIAAEYDETESYAVGDYCIYSDHYYKCNTAIPSGGETWDATHWDSTTLGAEDKAINTNLSNLGGSGYTAPPTGSYGTNVSYVDGGYCKIGKLVILNMRVAASQTIPVSGVLVSNLPIPAATNNIVSVTNNRKADITLGSLGQIGNADQLAQGNIILSCAYITT